ncbi:MAG TPA: coenzyme F420-0:L-glutamate ligase [Anaerolineales bacterium]|nr:coenzyme F420-0:L-glutamate ligase [Anaerolineales bacterium]
MNKLTLTPLSGLPMIQPGDDLAALILAAMQRADLRLEPGDIFVLAQKIVSKTEGRKVNLATVIPSPRAQELGAQIEKDPRLVELILRESSGDVLRTRPGLIIVEHRLGFVCANAGIDHSNVAGDDEWVLLLPENPDASAEKLRLQLEQAVEQIGNPPYLGVMIIDSHGRAWRNGTVGVAIGISGLPGVMDLRGQADLTGRILQVTQVGAADELAAAASLVMGQAAEGTPVVHVRGFPYPLREGTLQELIRPKALDLFR